MTTSRDQGDHATTSTAEDTIEGAAEIKDEHLPVFDCAFQPPNGTRSIAWKAHIRMMAAAQPFISGAISKTVNMPKDATVDDVKQAYLEGWRLGLKALAIYRDGSKGAQPLSTKKKKKDEAEKTIGAPRRERLPDTRNSITHKFNVAGHEGYITVGLYPDGRPGELFITMAKEGSTIGGMMDCFGTAVSMSLQYGVPLEVYVKKFSHTRFEPMGHTKNPDVRFAKSIIDYIFRWLAVTFLPGYREANNGEAPALPGSEYGGVGGSEIESMPAAMMAGGQTAGQGQAAIVTATPNGNSTNGQTTNGQSTNGQTNGRTNGSANRSGVKTKATIAVLQRTAISTATIQAPIAVASRSEQFASFQTDAPACDSCGAITVRNGNCYLCHNCGNSMGCS